MDQAHARNREDESATVSSTPPAGQRRLRAEAILVGAGIDFPSLGSKDRLGAVPLVVDQVPTGQAFLFRYGAAVFFGVGPSEMADCLSRISPHIRQPLPAAERETEVLDIRVDPATRESIEHNTLVLSDESPEKLQLVADVMAKSVSLAHHERGIERQFERIEPFAGNLDHWGRGGRAASELLHNLGAALLAEHRVVAGTRVEDAPDLLWDHPELERLWARVRDEFEIRERFAALHGKLTLISRTAETALELLQNRRALRVEWAIVGLIIFEIVVTLAQWALGGR